MASFSARRWDLGVGHRAPATAPVELTVIATSKSTLGELLLVVYAIGAAIPMLAIAYGRQAVTTRVRSISRVVPNSRRVLASL